MWTGPRVPVDAPSFAGDFSDRDMDLAQANFMESANESGGIGGIGGRKVKDPEWSRHGDMVLFFLCANLVEHVSGDMGVFKNVEWGFQIYIYGKY